MKKSLSAIIFAILLTSVFVFSSFPMLSAANSNQTTSTNTSASSGNWINNVEDPVYNESTNTYHIASASQLAYISKDIASGSWTFRNAEIVLDNDIDLSAYYWTPIGINNRIIFNGTFDGNWHKITGLNVKDAAYAGLFGYVGIGATIENLIVENAKVSGKTYAGTIAGYSNYYYYGSATFSNLIVINPKVESTNTSSSYAGGIVGYKEGGSIKNCYVQKNDSNEGAKITSGGGSAGGIVGLLGVKGYPNITLCYNNAEILSESSVASTISCSGGIVGYSNNSSAKIDQCYNTGKITSTSTKQNSYSGGIAGYLLGGTISNCYNEGEINSEVQGYDTYFNYDLDMYEEDWSSLSSKDSYGYENVNVKNECLDINGYESLGLSYNNWNSILYKSPKYSYLLFDGPYIDTINYESKEYTSLYDKKFNIPKTLRIVENGNFGDDANNIGSYDYTDMYISKDVYNPRGEKLKNENISKTINEDGKEIERTFSNLSDRLNAAQITTNNTGSYVGVNKYSGHTGGIAGSTNRGAIKSCYNCGTINANGCAKTKYFNMVYQIYRAFGTKIADIFNLRGIPTCRLQLLVNFDIDYYSDNICGEQIGNASITNCFYEKSKQIKKELRVNCNQAVYIMCKNWPMITYKKGITPEYKFSTITGYSYQGDNSPNPERIRNMTKNKWGSPYNVGTFYIYNSEKNCYEEEDKTLYAKVRQVVADGSYPWYLNFASFYSDDINVWHSPFSLRLFSFFTIDTTDPNQIKFYINYQFPDNKEISGEGMLYEAINTKYQRNNQNSDEILEGDLSVDMYNKLYNSPSSWKYGEGKFTFIGNDTNENININSSDNKPYFTESTTNKVDSLKNDQPLEDLNSNNNSTELWAISGAINNGYPHLKGFYW